MVNSQSDDLRLTFSYLQPLLSQVWRLEFQKTHSAELRLYLHININIQYDNKLWKTCSDPELNHQGQGWEFAHSFSERIERFFEKMSKCAIRSKKHSIREFTHFCWATYELLTVALLSWATWAICSRSLFWHKRSERFAHSRSLSWAIWANHSQSLIWSERMSYEQMSEFPTLIRDRSVG